jgi:hypothetical protein
LRVFFSLRPGGSNGVSGLSSGRAFPGVTRPLCPYPQVARYDGGDPDSAESFSCR